MRGKKLASKATMVFIESKSLPPFFQNLTPLTFTIYNNGLFLLTSSFRVEFVPAVKTINNIYYNKTIYHDLYTTMHKNIYSIDCKFLKKTDLTNLKLSPDNKLQVTVQTCSTIIFFKSNKYEK